MRWRDGTFQRYGEDFGMVASIARRVRDKELAETFVQCVEIWLSRGIVLSARQQSDNYGPKWAAQLSHANGYGVADMKRGMAVAFDHDLIAVGPTGVRDATRREKHGIILRGPATTTGPK